jgi:hypothetical protein
MLQYLHNNWSHAGILIAIYVTLVLLCIAHYLDLFTLLVWLQFPVYLVHEFEEHTYPGGFKKFVNRSIFHVYDKDIPLTDERVFWINILAVWVMFPLTAVATQFIHPVLGLLTPCFSLMNASLHIISGVINRSYNPGLLTSIFLNYPLGMCALYVGYCEGYLLSPYFFCALFISFSVHVMMVAIAFYWYRQWTKKTL